MKPCDEELPPVRERLFGRQPYTRISLAGLPNAVVVERIIVAYGEIHAIAKGGRYRYHGGAWEPA